MRFLSLAFVTLFLISSAAQADLGLGDNPTPSNEILLSGLVVDQANKTVTIQFQAATGFTKDDIQVISVSPNTRPEWDPTPFEQGIDFMIKQNSLPQAGVSRKDYVFEFGFNELGLSHSLKQRKIRILNRIVPRQFLQY